MAGHEISAVVDGDEVKAAMLKLLKRLRKARADVRDAVDPDDPTKVRALVFLGDARPRVLRRGGAAGMVVQEGRVVGAAGAGATAGAGAASVAACCCPESALHYLGFVATRCPALPADLCLCSS